MISSTFLFHDHSMNSSHLHLGGICLASSMNSHEFIQTPVHWPQMKSLPFFAGMVSGWPDRGTGRKSSHGPSGQQNASLPTKLGSDCHKGKKEQQLLHWWFPRAAQLLLQRWDVEAVEGKSCGGWFLCVFFFLWQTWFWEIQATYLGIYSVDLTWERAYMYMCERSFEIRICLWQSDCPQDVKIQSLTSGPYLGNNVRLPQPQEQSYPVYYWFWEVAWRVRPESFLLLLISLRSFRGDYEPSFPMCACMQKDHIPMLKTSEARCWQWCCWWCHCQLMVRGMMLVVVLLSADDH